MYVRVFFKTVLAGQLLTASDAFSTPSLQRVDDVNSTSNANLLVFRSIIETSHN